MTFKRFKFRRGKNIKCFFGLKQNWKIIDFAITFFIFICEHDSDGLQCYGWFRKSINIIILSKCTLEVNISNEDSFDLDV